MNLNDFPHEVIIETVKGCNLICSYCYVNHSRDGVVPKVQVMSTDVLKAFIPKFLQTAGSLARFDWHGGEPLLAGTDYYLEALELQKGYAESGQTILNVLQTNATLINDDWLELFHKNHFRIGVSFDGTPDIHDTHRRNFSGAPSSKSVLNGLEKLIQSGIPVSILMVVTEECVGKEETILNFLLGLGIESVDFLPCTIIDPITGSTIPPSISPDQFGKFLVDMYDVWRKPRNKRVVVRVFDVVHAGLLKKKFSTCHYSGKCNHMVALDFDGSIYACGRFLGSHGVKFGSLIDNSYENIIGNLNYQEWYSRLEANRSVCKDCKWYSVCHGGCPAYAVQQDGGRRDHTCRARQMLFSHAEINLNAYLRERNIIKVGEIVEL